MEMKILFLQENENDPIKSCHIVSNKQATYICPFYCKEDTEVSINEKYLELINSDLFKDKAKEKGFDLGIYSCSSLNLLTIKSYE